MTANNLEGKALVAGDSRKPKFGEWLRGIYASERNPQRDGMYVRTVRRTGRFNAGVWYELTDGKGNFWRYESKSTVYLAAALDTARPNDLDATVAQRDALSGKVVAYRMFDREAVEAFRKWCPWIDGEPSQASFDVLKDRYEFQFAYADTARQSEGMVLVPREPTDEMLIAAGTVSGWDGNPNTADTDHIAWWKAMIAAAPADAGEG